MHENFLQNTDMLLLMLDHFDGIRGLPYRPFSSSLQDRQQYTLASFGQLPGG